MAGLLPAIQATLGAWQKPVRRCRRRNGTAVEITFQRKDDATHVTVVPHASNQAGLTESRQGVTQLHQPAAQTPAGCVTDPHVLDHFRRTDSALLQIYNCLAVAVQLHGIECHRFLEQRREAVPLAEQRQGLRKAYLVIEFSKANHIAAAATTVAVEQAFGGIHHEAWLTIAVQRAHPHPTAATEPP